MRDLRPRARPEEAAAAPYPERADDDTHAADRYLRTVGARLATRFGGRARRYVRRCTAVEEASRAFEGLDDAAFQRAVEEVRHDLQRRGFAPDLVTRSFALIREASARCTGLRHYPVQLLAGLVMMDGALAEMQTGEGKTLTAALPAATAALAGLPVHVITVNDYLAARDADLLRPVYAALGLTVGVVQQDQDEPSRRAAYACDVTYVVNKEVAFDYLRDRLTVGRTRSAAARAIAGLGGNTPPLLLRGLCFAVVDEADSILIDEACTPLIISGPHDTAADVPYAVALEAAREMVEGRDFRVEGARGQQAALTPSGRAKLATRLAGVKGAWGVRRAREDLVMQALAALHLFIRDRHYVVQDGKVQIVDEHTGRIATGRAWQNGLHQLIEMKEGCATTERRATRASITYQRFFGRYLHLAGMSGTLAEVAAELRATYGLATIRIPTHRPARRTVMRARLYRTSIEKQRALVETVRAEAMSRRPILIGTASVEASEALSRSLAEAGVAHVTLNANHPEEEAAIIAEAGQIGRVTVATNMAGRGTDILLGPGVADRGGLHVILTEYHSSSRIDRQFVGRGGRQGDPSSTMTLCALDDELMIGQLPRLARALSKSSTPLRIPGLVHLLRRSAQARAAASAVRMRRATERSQRDADRALGFAWRE